MILSVIIPIYNTEKHLSRCLDSICNQTFLNHSSKNVEILLVDNNSTDNSPKTAKNIIKNNPNISFKLLNCKIKGASAVRNFAVKKASGKYMWFIDGDDHIAPKAIEKLIKCAEKNNSDFVMLGAQRLYKKQQNNKYLRPIKPNERKGNFVQYGPGPWQFLFNREWWIKNHFQFKEGIIHEDIELMPSLILFTDNYSVVDEPLYFYEENENSVLHKTKWSNSYFDIFSALEGMYKRFEEQNALKNYVDDIEYFFIWNLLLDSAQDFKKFKEGHPGFKKIRQFLTKYFPKWRKNKFLKNKSLILQIRFRLAYHGIVL
ncbi:glycosyltransferase [Candidatus Saccharibacteria bacterium]|nr:glycosyltransferase [Candidatus Saccharibacteria bacterium]